MSAIRKFVIEEVIKAATGPNYIFVNAMINDLQMSNRWDGNQQREFAVALWDLLFKRIITPTQFSLASPNDLLVDQASLKVLQAMLEELPKG